MMRHACEARRGEARRGSVSWMCLPRPWVVGRRAGFAGCCERFQLGRRERVDDAALDGVQEFGRVYRARMLARGR